MTDQIDTKLAALGRSRFRSRFHLGPRERAILQEKGLSTIQQHARDLLATRLFVAQPQNDTRQTPWRGHPVFIAQHATATCCRKCLQRWHGIEKGQALTANQQQYILDLILAWLRTETV